MMAKTNLTSSSCQLYAFILFSVILSFKAQISYVSALNFVPISYDAVMGHEYPLLVDRDKEYLLQYHNPKGVSSTSPAHIYVESEDATSDHPVLIVLRQAKGVLSWQIPLVVGASQYRKTSRILCPDANYYRTQNFTSGEQKNLVEEDNSFFVSISSGSQSEIVVRLKVVTLANFSVNANTDYQVPANNSEFQFTPSQPWYYQFKWPENMTLGDGNVTTSTMKSVVVKVHSSDDICMTMSIQSLTCPVLDLERTVGYEGFRQTIDRKGGVTLTKDEFPVGFHIVFVVNQDDTKCFSKGYSASASEDRSKTISFKIYETISFETFVIALMTPIVAIVSIYVLFFIAAIVCVCRPYRVASSTSTSNLVEEATDNMAGPSNVSTIGDTVAEAERDSERGQPRQEEDVLSYDESVYDCGGSNVLLNIDRYNEKPVFVCDLSVKPPAVLRRKSDLYAINLTTVAVFYALPVFQLMYSYQSILQKTGNQDTCFYNFLCAYPYRLSDSVVIADFNHVFSNIGYLGLGLLFLFWTSRRDAMHNRAVTTRPELDTKRGIPQHYGLFYALGLALIMEGFLSGMYHICPNETNFQFDTSFMYVIAVLCMVKLYQNRHPDINASAYSTFFTLAFIIFVGMIGIMENSEKFFIVFSVAHVGMCLYLSRQVYNMRPLYFGRRVFRGIRRERVSGSGQRRLVSESQPAEEPSEEIVEGRSRRALRSIKPNYPTRLGLLIIANVANWALVYFGENWGLKTNFGSYLLTVLLTNLVLYFLFYIIMKLICGERIYLEPLMYIVVGTILWGLSGVFFFSRMTSWTSTPAGSRHNNEVCDFLNFYDNHDIWHFLSAGSMFCTFMVLLTLDDDLVEVPRTEIKIF